MILRFDCQNPLSVGVGGGAALYKEIVAMLCILTGLFEETIIVINIKIRRICYENSSGFQIKGVS